MSATYSTLYPFESRMLNFKIDFIFHLKELILCISGIANLLIFSWKILKRKTKLFVASLVWCERMDRE